MAARTDLTDYDRWLIEAARQSLAAAQSMSLLDASDMARMIGRLEATVESLIAMVEPPVPGGEE